MPFVVVATNHGGIDLPVSIREFYGDHRSILPQHTSLVPLSGMPFRSALVKHVNKDPFASLKRSIGRLYSLAKILSEVIFLSCLEVSLHGQALQFCFLSILDKR